MAVMRSSLAKSYRWYTHISSAPDSFLGIQARGIEPRLPRGTIEIPDEVTTAFGPGNERIVCLYVPGTECGEVIPDGTPPLFRMALEAKDLPKRVGIDWTYVSWQMTGAIVQQDPTISVDRLICQLVRRYSVLVCYDPIPATALRVCDRKSDPLRPERWPLLSSLTDAQTLRHY